MPDERGLLARAHRRLQPAYRLLFLWSLNLLPVVALAPRTLPEVARVVNEKKFRFTLDSQRDRAYIARDEAIQPRQTRGQPTMTIEQIKAAEAELNREHAAWVEARDFAQEQLNRIGQRKLELLDMQTEALKAKLAALDKS